jgi:quercetin dioxygenase-like cupin family protein
MIYIEEKPVAFRFRTVSYSPLEFPMPTLVAEPKIIEAAGNKPKIIEEFVGRVNSNTTAASIARMRSPEGWIEPGQSPEFDEYTVVLRGLLRVTSTSGVIDVRAGQAIITHRGEWVQYSTPDTGGAEYIAVCLPAFSLDTVHRDA